MEFLKAHHKQRGVALVTVLVIISLLTILVMAYMSTSRIDEQSSTAFADTQRAKLVAKGAVAHAIEILRNNIPQPAGLDRTIDPDSANPAVATNWIVNPGRLTLIDESHEEELIDLHTGEVDINPDLTADPDVHSVDLNAPIPGKLDSDNKAIPAITYALNDDGTPDRSKDRPRMRVKWVNILKDPSKEAAEDNPIVARHAFWMDDESGKINFNTAMGKSDPDVDQFFKEELELQMMPALFRGGDKSSFSTNNSTIRKFGLGNSRSVNLDVLLENPDDLDKDQLLNHSMLRGFSRYPEAVMDFIKLTDPEERSEWWYGNRYNLTSYNRSPEFNVFGFPRFMTTYTPLSLEGGPTYQNPFVYPAPAAGGRLNGILHANNFYGVLNRKTVVGARPGRNNRGDGLNNETLVNGVSPRGVLSLAQITKLLDYMGREFPGHQGSFVDKYGEIECAQIALNILAMSQLATESARGTGNQFKMQLGFIYEQLGFTPPNSSGPALKPERHYFWYRPGEGFLTDLPDKLEDEPNEVGDIPMLPVFPGPYITEVRLQIKPEAIKKKPNLRYLKYRFAVEYYLPGITGNTNIATLPFKMDYVHVFKGTPDSPQETFLKLGTEEVDRNWDSGYHNTASKRTRLAAMRLQGNADITPQSRRRKVEGGWHYITKEGKTAEFGIFSPLPLVVAFRGGLSPDPEKGQPNGYKLSAVNSKAVQMIPLGVTEDDVLEASIDIDLENTSGYSASWQIEDPRLSANKDQWQLEQQNDLSAGTLGGKNVEEPEEGSSEKSKFRFPQISYTNHKIKLDDFEFTHPVVRGEEMESTSKVSSKGFWSFIHTGVQGNPTEGMAPEPWRTLALEEDASQNLPGPPDWILMDLIGATQPIQNDQRKINATLPDEFSTISYMHSTTGAINLNTRTFPENDYFNAPARSKPLEAVFKHLMDYDGDGSEEEEMSTLLEKIKAYQDDHRFKYVGDLAYVDGSSGDASATQWEKEKLLRNMINCLTTKSNTFGVWGVGQVVNKTRENENWGEFEDGDSVRSEKRFFAIIERYIWPGVDGVPGNAHVNSSGELDRLPQQTKDIPLTDSSIKSLLFQLPGSAPNVYDGWRNRLIVDINGTYPPLDGPQRVEMGPYGKAALGDAVWNETPLEEAYNPPQAVTKYRVVYFKYLDE
ncbi:MAG: hypothetical protein P1U89_10515 [Verrucomicrobiales bacterium]|nr:hypothetical protein [Verrucomicrobiales bacterium]